MRHVGENLLHEGQATSTRLSPLAACSRASSMPNPLDAPVMSAVLFVLFISLLIYFRVQRYSKRRNVAVYIAPIL